MHHGPDGSLDAFLQGLDGEFAEELRRALDRGPRRAPDHASQKEPDAVPRRDEYREKSGRDAVDRGTRADAASHRTAR